MKREREEEVEGEEAKDEMEVIHHDFLIALPLSLVHSLGYLVLPHPRPWEYSH